MDFLRFAKEQATLSVVLVISVLLTAYGLVSQAQEIYALGLPGWVWQAIGFAIFFAAVVRMLYKFHQRLPKPQQEGTATSEGMDELDTDWMTKLKVIQGQTFLNREVEIDGNHYINCTFENVTLNYRGGPWAFNNNTFGRSVHVAAVTPALGRYTKLLYMLGYMKVAVAEGDGKPLSQDDFDRKYQLTRETIPKN